MQQSDLDMKHLGGTPVIPFTIADSGKQPTKPKSLFAAQHEKKISQKQQESAVDEGVAQGA